MAYPKIIYAPSAGPTVLAFTYPNVGKPESPDTGAGDEMDAVRHDTITCSGLKQSILERIDVFKTLQMDNVPMADLAAWRTFLNYALQGGQFDYYPDASDDFTFDTWTLEDMKWP